MMEVLLFANTATLLISLFLTFLSLIFLKKFDSCSQVDNSSVAVLFSGVSYNGTTFDADDTWIIDFSTNSWEQRRPSNAPVPRGYYASDASGTEVIIFGGRTEGVDILNDLWRYNIKTGVWTQDTYLGNTTAPIRTFHSGVLVGNIFYVFGGYAAEIFTSSNDLWGYDIVTKTWKLLIAHGVAGSPPARQGHTAVPVNDKSSGPGFIIFGGYTGKGGFNDAWRYHINTGKWAQIEVQPPLPPPRFGHSSSSDDFVTGDGSEVLIFGGDFVGENTETYHNDLWSLKVTGNIGAWKILVEDGNTQGPWKRAGHTSVKYLKYFFTFGGYGQFVGLYNDLWRFDYEF